MSSIPPEASPHVVTGRKVSNSARKRWLVFSEHVGKHRGYTLNLTVKKIGDIHVAEDIVQDINTTWWRRLLTERDFRLPERKAVPPADGKKGQVSIARWVAWGIGTYRKAPATLARAQSVPFDEVAAKSGSVNVGLKYEFRDMLDKLPDNWRDLVELYFVAGLSHEEIATAEGVAKSTVTTWFRSFYEWSRLYFPAFYSRAMVVYRTRNLELPKGPSHE